ncbi:hypothetical protein JHK87_050940 [Glycine soja]|nr:hypothetical protein JHK87_050940 [Glycine soja]
MVKLASKEPLCGKVPLVHIYDSILKVKDVWNGMDWDLHKLYSTLPQSAAADVVSVKPMRVPFSRSITFGSWLWGDVEMIVLNVDESVTIDVRKAGYGGLCTNHSGEFLVEMGALSNIFMLMSFTLSIGIGIWIIQFDRILREDNTCADVLAKTGPRLRICFISTLWECLSRL